MCARRRRERLATKGDICIVSKNWNISSRITAARPELRLRTGVRAPGRQRQAAVAGLIEIEKLSGYSYDTKKSGLEGRSPGQVAPSSGMSGGGAGEESPALARRNGDFSQNPENSSYRESQEEERVVTIAPPARKPNGAASAGAR